MSLTVTGFSNSALTYKIATETNAGATLGTNAFSDIFGGSGTLYAIDIDHKESNTTAYLKLKITSGDVVIGTTQPDLMFEVGASTAVHINIPTGLTFSQLSFWVTSDPATSHTSDPGETLITFLCA